MDFSAPLGDFGSSHATPVPKLATLIVRHEMPRRSLRNRARHLVGRAFGAPVGVNLHHFVGEQTSFAHLLTGKQQQPSVGAQMFPCAPVPGKRKPLAKTAKGIWHSLRPYGHLSVTERPALRVRAPQRRGTASPTIQPESARLHKERSCVPSATSIPNIEPDGEGSGALTVI